MLRSFRLFLLFFCVITEAAAEEHYIIFYVDAPKLCYDSFGTLCQSLARVEKDKRGKIRLQRNVGHAWLALYGTLDGCAIDLTIGHSGEMGVMDRPYFEGVMDLVEQRHPNPISYLFKTLRDGFPQLSSGGHVPTFAVKRSLTEEQLRTILRFIHPKRCPYAAYGLTGLQCASFVAHVSVLAGCPLAHKITVPIPQYFTYGGWKMRLWTDCRYSKITFSSPDKIEESLKQLVERGEAEALSI